MDWIAKQEENFDRNRFGAMTMLITLQSCVAALATATSIAVDNWLFVSIVAVVAMASNALFIAQTNAKSCLYTFYASMIVSTIVLLVNWMM